MKPANFLNLLLLSLVLAVAAAGCKKNPYGITPLGARSKTPGGDLGPGGLIGGGSPFGSGSAVQGTDGTWTTADPSVIGTWPKNREALAAYTVYFEFDSAAVRGDESAKIQTVADYLRSNPAEALEIEGHCDERGTEEYNRALGERRALALREYLINLGVDANRVLTVSYGEDKPAVDGQNESAWSMNRRGEFIVLTPP